MLICSKDILINIKFVVDDLSVLPCNIGAIVDQFLFSGQIVYLKQI